MGVVWCAGTRAAADVDPRAALWPIRLKCESDHDPLGVDVLRPRLSWNLEGDGRHRKQTAYRILVASSKELLDQDRADLWDSGRVRSEEMIGIPYGGKPLSSSRRVFWKVMVWDEKNRPGPWSLPASWVTGLLSDSDWVAQWIGPADTNLATALLRHEFVLGPGIRSAIIHICGLGQYELTINGARATDAVLTPGWTKYDRTCLYDTYDVTQLVRPGTNAVGVFLAGGMYRVTGGRYTKFKGSFGPLQAIAQLVIEYADGRREVIGTSEAWKTAPGPITFSCVYGGEDYDARLYPHGWDQPGFDSVGWSNAVVRPGPGGRLRGHSASAPPIRPIEVLSPQRITRPAPNTAVYDFGQNASIMVRLTCVGESGAKIRMIPAELLGTNGLVDRRSCGGGRAWWEYTLAGAGRETWSARFFYHGARYVQVERIPAPGSDNVPAVVSLEAVVVHSTSEPVGDFACSNELFNRIRRLVRWAQRSNMMSVLTDCPHRERLGWLEQYHLNGPALRYEFDLTRLYTKALRDMADSQLQNGALPNIAPEYVVFGRGPNDLSDPFRDSPEWNSAVVLVPWQQYLFTGSLQLAEEFYPVMERYMGYLDTRATNHLLDYGLGDWYDLGPKPPGFAQLTPRALTATAFYYHDATIMAELAQRLGLGSRARAYSDLAKRIKHAFNAAFLDLASGRYATGSQCAQAVPLAFELCPEQVRPLVLQRLLEDITARDYANTAGDVGFRFVLRALADADASDVIYRMLNQTNRPGYGYQLAMGATSLTEAWNARPSASQNHFMLGQVIEWFYSDLAGIRPDPAAPGFKSVVIRPAFVEGLDWVSASYTSVRGEIVSAWRRTGDVLAMRVRIPHNCMALVHVPGRSAAEIMESGMRADRNRDVKVVRTEGGRVVFRVGSGEYQFITRMPASSAPGR